MNNSLASYNDILIYIGHRNVESTEFDDILENLNKKITEVEKERML